MIFTRLTSSLFFVFILGANSVWALGQQDQKSNRSAATSEKSFSDVRLQAIVHYVLSDLNLQDEQRQKIDAIVKKTFSDISPLLQERKENKEKLFSALASYSVNQFTVENIRQEQNKNWTSINKRITQGLIEMANTLSPDQRVKLIDNFRQRRFFNSPLY